MAKEDISKNLDNDIYEKEYREILVDDDEISPLEECFMDGYDNSYKE